MKFTKVNMKGHIESVISYYRNRDAMHILQFQLCYNNSPRPARPYQVVTFEFVNDSELKRFIRDVKTSLGVTNLCELKNKEADIAICLGKDEDLISDAEISSISIGEDEKRHWYPVSVGVFDELKSYPTVFAYN